MLKKRNYAIFLFLTVLIISCNLNERKSDAFGNFEADETVVSSEMPGKIISFNYDEGTSIRKGEIIVQIDTSRLFLQKKQIEAKIEALNLKIPDVSADIKVLETKLKNAEKEKNRIENLFNQNSTTQQTLDNIKTEVAVIEAQISALEFNADKNTSSLLSERKPLIAQLRSIEDEISRCTVKNHIDGTILVKYHKEGEIIMSGTPLYKIADLDTLILRAYVSGSQLNNMMIGEKVLVLTDNDKNGFNTIEGIITWVNSTSEFTPKMIQTKEERVNFVYAIKVKVPNNGELKIGMPAEVIFGDN